MPLSPKQYVRRCAAYLMAGFVCEGMQETFEDPKLPVSLDDRRDSCLIVGRTKEGDITLKPIRDEARGAHLHKFVKEFVLRPQQYLKTSSNQW